jgi:hypothetical protein
MRDIGNNYDYFSCDDFQGRLPEIGKSVGGLNSSHHIRLSLVKKYQIFYCPYKCKHSILLDVLVGRHCPSAAYVLNDGTLYPSNCSNMCDGTWCP